MKIAWQLFQFLWSHVDVGSSGQRWMSALNPVKVAGDSAPISLETRGKGRKKCIKVKGVGFDDLQNTAQFATGHLVAWKLVEADE